MGKFEDLEKLQKLKENGVITQEEFDIEKAKILNSTNNDTANNSNDVNNMLEIRGEFPFVESKIPIELLDGERVIIQYDNSIYKNASGIITLTNKRIMFNKKNSAKSFLKTGLFGVALGAGDKDVNIEFSKIISIECPKPVSGIGILKITTKDGYTHNMQMLSKTTMHKDGINVRDTIAELIQNVISSK